MNLSPISLHKCGAFIMLVAVTATTFNKAIVVVDFRLNKNYIASALCQNRDKPKSCCRGKCFLKKQLQKTAEEGKNGIPVSKDKFDVPLFKENISTNNFTPQITYRVYSDYYRLKKYSTTVSSVFHPPGRI